MTGSLESEVFLNIGWMLAPSSEDAAAKGCLDCRALVNVSLSLASVALSLVMESLRDLPPSGSLPLLLANIMVFWEMPDTNFWMEVSSSLMSLSV